MPSVQLICQMILRVCWQKRQNAHGALTLALVKLHRTLNNRHQRLCAARTPPRPAQNLFAALSTAVTRVPSSDSEASTRRRVQWVWLPDMTAGESSRETDIAGRLEWLTVYSTSSTRLEMPSFSKMWKRWFF